MSAGYDFRVQRPSNIASTVARICIWHVTSRCRVGCFPSLTIPATADSSLLDLGGLYIQLLHQKGISTWFESDRDSPSCWERAQERVWLKRVDRLSLPSWRLSSSEAPKSQDKKTQDQRKTKRNWSSITEGTPPRSYLATVLQLNNRKNIIYERSSELSIQGPPHIPNKRKLHC